ncbi:MAG: hypothetical protein Athens071425_517 [Parcubacteria group bacterium Athens0714_25]|nr:MAG: hypothetical protein Athens071425_517 [Parcubacteria group bacterium Athens0714_25]
MKNFLRSLTVIFFVVALLSGCAGKELRVENASLPENQVNLLVQPHQSLGLEPTLAISKGDISTFMVVFPLKLFGEYYPGRLRWNTWTILDDNSERFGQVIFSGMHPSGQYFGTEVIDGQISSGQTAILSSAVDYIYSPYGRELPVERGKFLADPAYRKEKIREVNTDENGNIFNLSSLSRIEKFQYVIKTWNQIQYPEGYLLSPCGVNEVAKIRGINPQYSYFQKLIGTGTFRINPIPDPTGFAICNSINVAMDLIGAGNAPSTGWDYNSEIPNRRNMAFTMEYLLILAQNEVYKRNQFNAKQLTEALSAPRR